MDSTKNVNVPINLLECIRLHTRGTNIFSFCCRTSTSNKTYAWVQNTIHVALYMHYAWKIGGQRFFRKIQGSGQRFCTKILGLQILRDIQHQVIYAKVHKKPQNSNITQL